jgi:predicted aspartyl protease
MIRSSLLAVVLLLVLLVRTPVRAMGGHWEPPGLHPTAATLAAILSAYETSRGKPAADYAQRIERYSLVAGTTRLATTAYVRDADFRFHTEIAGAAYESGRSATRRWRRTPNGLVRIIASDIQGDDLDRWPLAIFPFDASDCVVAGESGGPQLLWVIQYRPEHDVPHWFYVDEKSGAIVRETFREGARIVTFAFEDFRTVDGTERPYRWHVSGAGGELDVTVEQIELLPVSVDQVALPPRGAAPFDPPIDEPVTVPAIFRGRRIILEANVDGKPEAMFLDTGTTQILLDESAAREAGIRTVLGHGIASDISVGPVHLHEVAIQTVGLGGFRAQGILGYELFAGVVVHVDYRGRHVELIPRNGFEPPADAQRLDAWCEEGMPLITGRVGDRSADRFVLDTGSARVVLTRYFWEHDGGEPGLVHRTGFLRSNGYLEGTIVVGSGEIAELAIGGVAVRKLPASVELTGQGDTVEFPLDGIIGTDVLGGFEWWFDYSGDTAWFRLAL